MCVRSSAIIDPVSVLLDTQDTKSLHPRAPATNYVGCSDDGVCQLVIGPPLLETVDYCAVVYVEMQGLTHAPVWVGDHGDEDAQGLAGGRGVRH